MTEPVEIHIVRHGQTDLNRDKRFRGLSDAPLNAEGRREAAGAADILSGSGVSLIHSSPVPRALETSRIIAEHLGARVEPDEAFTDIDYGEWQGLTVDEVAERFGRETLESWRRDPYAFTFPGGDSMSEVRERVAPALECVAAGGESIVAVVSHLAVIKVCFVTALELGFGYFWKVELANGSVSRFSHTARGGFVLEVWNREPDVGSG